LCSVCPISISANVQILTRREIALDSSGRAPLQYAHLAAGSRLGRMNFRPDSSAAPKTRRSSPLTLTALSVSLAAVMAFTGCETPGQTALAGAAAGAAIGGALHGRGEDALRGAAIGAGTGYIAGRVARNQRERAYREGYYDARYGDRYDGRRYYRDRYGDRYFIGRDGRRYYVD
jgi:osmotically inducible lipoprotein OsmB